MNTKNRELKKRLKLNYLPLLIFYRMRFFFIINIIVKMSISAIKDFSFASVLGTISALSLLFIIILTRKVTDYKMNIAYVKIYKNLLDRK